MLTALHRRVIDPRLRGRDQRISMRVAAAAGAARAGAAGAGAVAGGVHGGDAQQLRKALAAAGFARRRFSATDEVFLFFVAVGTEEFVEGHWSVA